MEIQIDDKTNQENIITPFKYILITDNKGNKEFCIVNNKKQRIGRKYIDLSFFENKKLNSFWEIGQETKEIKEITSKDFFKENICKNFLIKSKMKK